MAAPALTPSHAPRYAPIADHGAIGDGRGAALVTRAGTVDWWSPGRFDAPSVFASILDADRGGAWSLAPVDPARSVQRYVEDTNVLATEHRTARGRALVLDLVPFEVDAGVHDAILLRRVRVLEGDVEFETRFAPRFQYGRVAPRFGAAPSGILATGAGEVLHLASTLAWERAGEGVRCVRFALDEGATVDLVLRHAPFASPAPFHAPLTRPVDDLVEATIARWRVWAARTTHLGPHLGLVRRSALALKLLQAPGGAIMAAATTSLPEAIGGVRNWDYRYAWIRDGVLAARALRDAGHEEDARLFAGWLARALDGGAGDALRIVYTLSGSGEIPERVLSHLEGHRGSAPVRIGNEAVTQRQLDVYGELLDFLALLGDRASWPLVRSAAEWVFARWREPDHGIWEMRTSPRHFVLSKVMAWVALDRASRLAQAWGESGDAAWAREAEAIRAEVLDRGYDRATGSFVQAYGFPGADASNLLLPLVGFIDARDPRMVGTVDRIVRELCVDGLVYRYRGDDGLPGGEATFAYCAFWLVEVLALQGRIDEARELFDRLATRASPTGLYAEEIDANTGEHLGNYPQAFPHAGLIQAARALARAGGG